MQKSFLWNGLLNDTEEHCAVNYLDKGIMIRSEVEGWAEGKPVYLDYTIKLDIHWNVLEFEVIFHISDIEHIHHFKRNASGGWIDNKNSEYPEFEACQYIDISLTPFTNTLPINGLNLALGQSHEFDLVYVDVMRNTIRKDHQRYTRIGPHSYRFENDSTNFTADIDVDADGLVTHYPKLFEMIQPK